MGYDGMGILVCFEWVRGHISKDVKLVLGLLFVLFLLLFTAGQGSACLTVTAKTLSSARPTRICRFFWEDELVPSRLDESWCFRLQHFWLKCMRFATGIWGCKMVKQAANICKLSKKKHFAQQNHASISPHNGPTGTSFLLPQGCWKSGASPRFCWLQKWSSALLPRRSLTAVGALGLAGGFWGMTEEMMSCWNFGTFPPHRFW